VRSKKPPGGRVAGAWTALALDLDLLSAVSQFRRSSRSRIAYGPDLSIVMSLASAPGSDSIGQTAFWYRKLGFS
jgi:hypothetical protein